MTSADLKTDTITKFKAGENCTVKGKGKLKTDFKEESKKKWNKKRETAKIKINFVYYVEKPFLKNGKHLKGFWTSVSLLVAKGMGGGVGGLLVK